MAENSAIEWTHHTFNPVLGCQKVGPGCDHCYAEGWAKRSGLVAWGPGETRRVTSDAYWRQPLKWDLEARAAGERRRVFCASLADVFDNAWPDGVRDRLWALIKATPNLDWMLLTKRPGNIANMLPDDWGTGYPNVWLGCTVVNQEEADRDIPKLLAVPAAVRFLSMEPLLGSVDLTAHLWGRAQPCPGCPRDADCDCGHLPRHMLGEEPDLALVIVGGESGPGARPMHPDWARSIRDQCQAAGVAFFFKQWGEWTPGENVLSEITGWRANATYGPWVGGDEWLFGETDMGDPEEDWHDEPDLYRVGKKAAGRLLDGRTWDQMPETP